MFNLTGQGTARQRPATPVRRISPAVSRVRKNPKFDSKATGRRHEGNPMLEWCFNVVGEPDRRGKFYPTKQRPEQKIDAEPERRCCAHGGGGPSDNGGQWAGGHFGVFAQSHFRLIGLPPAYRPVRKWPRESAAMRPGGQMPTKTAEQP